MELRESRLHIRLYCEITVNFLRCGNNTLVIYNNSYKKHIKIMKGKSQNTYNLNSSAKINTLHAHVCVQTDKEKVNKG